MKAVILLVVLAAYEYATVETFDLKSLRTKSVFWTLDRVEALIELPTQKIKSGEYQYKFDNTVQPACKSRNSPFVGIRVQNSQYPELTLIFDDDGKIAGMQASVLQSKFNPYKGSHATPEWFVEDGDYWTQTVYFTDPKNVCKKSISSPAFHIVKHASVGGPIETVEVPTKLLDAKDRGWVVGGCVQQMGIHLNKWTGGIIPQSACETTFVPFTPLYHPQSGNMIGFVMVRYVNLNDKNGDHPWYDFPPTGKGNYKYTFKEGEPAHQCFVSDPRWETITTTHTYFDPNPRNIKCDGGVKPEKWGSWYTEIKL